MSQVKQVCEFIAVIKGHTLDGNEAEFTYLGSLEILKRGDPKFKVVLSFREGDSTFSVDHTMRICYDEIYDLLDLSLCLHAIAERDHTIEEVRDVEGGTAYAHSAQLVMIQDLHSPCFVELFSKRTRKTTGYRCLWFFFRQDVSGRKLKVFDLLATPEEVRMFAKSLREIYERLWVIQSGTE